MEILRDTYINEAVTSILEFRLLLKVTCVPWPCVLQNEVLGQGISTNCYWYAKKEVSILKLL